MTASPSRLAPAPVFRQAWPLALGAGHFRTRKAADIAAVLMASIPNGWNSLTKPVTLPIEAFYGGRKCDDFHYLAIAKGCRDLKDARVTPVGTDAAISYFREISFLWEAVSARFDERLAPFLLNLPDDCAVCPLSEYLALKSVYSKKMYVILKDKLATASRYALKTDDFARMLDIPPVVGRNFARLKKGVLDVILKDLRSVGMDVAYDKELSGSGKVHVAGLVFRNRSSLDASLKIQSSNLKNLPAPRVRVVDGDDEAKIDVRIDSAFLDALEAAGVPLTVTVRRDDEPLFTYQPAVAAER